MTALPCLSVRRCLRGVSYRSPVRRRTRHAHRIQDNETGSERSTEKEWVAPPEPVALSRAVSCHSHA